MTASAPGTGPIAAPQAGSGSYTLGVQAWAAWAPLADDDEAPATQLVPALIRRRLSAPARMALHVVEACLGPRPVDVATVFASRHGELARTLELLEQVNDDSPMSPTAFSLSVHNAAAGAYSISRRSRAASTTVAAGRATLAQGLLEATAQCRSDAQPVLLVYVGGPPPGPYAPFAAAEERPVALAMLIETAGDAPAYRLRYRADAAELVDEPGLAVAQLLRGERASAQLAPPPHGWSLERAVG